MIGRMNPAGLHGARCPFHAWKALTVMLQMIPFEETDRCPRPSRISVGELMVSLRFLGAVSLDAAGGINAAFFFEHRDGRFLLVGGKIAAVNQVG